MNTTYQTLIVKFSESITALDGIFDDAGAWGTNTLKGWIDDYESTRFTATDSHTAVITSEYNMECVKEWLQRQTGISGERTQSDHVQSLSRGVPLHPYPLSFVVADFFIAAHIRYHS